MQCIKQYKDLKLIRYNNKQYRIWFKDRLIGEPMFDIRHALEQFQSIKEVKYGRINPCRNV